MHKCCELARKSRSDVVHTRIIYRWRVRVTIDVGERACKSAILLVLILFLLLDERLFTIVVVLNKLRNFHATSLSLRRIKARCFS